MTPSHDAFTTQQLFHTSLGEDRVAYGRRARCMIALLRLWDNIVFTCDVPSASCQKMRTYGFADSRDTIQAKVISEYEISRSELCETIISH